MKAYRHHHRGEVQPECGGVKGGNGCADTERNQRQNGEFLLSNVQHHQDCGECKKSRHLTQALQDTYFLPSECSFFYSEVIKHHLPGGERNGVSNRE